VATIGPITSQTAAAHGLEPDVLASQATVEALVASLVEAVAPDRSK
jgi:uroporphyrinogen-III synthase